MEEKIAIMVNGRLYDLSYVPGDDAGVKSITFADAEGKQIYWHSTAHILAQAVMELFPDVKLAIGPAIENGFYYDFDSSYHFTPEDLGKIENKMQEIINRDTFFVRKAIKKDKAIKLFTELNQPYKVELLNELEDNISIYEQDNFVDLCIGPHIPSTGRIGVFKLLKLAGAYWRGDENKPMLQRIYGVSFPTQTELDTELKRLEEAKERDHRKLGKELDLFSIFEDAGPGLVSWYPNGAIIREIIENFWKQEHRKRGYQLVYTPHIAKAHLWKISGHFDYYEQMTVLKFGEDDYVLKPMNCIYHILMYTSHTRSYKELPIKYAELGTVYRYERSGVLYGLTRVRGFTQDDAHIFCHQTQVLDEVLGVLDLAIQMLKTFGFSEFKINLSVRDSNAKSKYAGSDEQWELAESVLAQAIETRNLQYKRVEGEAVFYGPKIDIELLDALGRGWQGPTIQFDFNLPQRFNVQYIDKDNKPHPVIMIHRTVLGSMERFVGCLTEHYKGAFPVWIAPVQIVIASITEKAVGYAKSVSNELQKYRIKLSIDNEPIGAKIRETSLNKVPYMLIVGQKEMEMRTVSVRERGKGNIGVLKIEEFIELLDKKLETLS
ncbi:MAG: threonine--tRNA ligase [Candidatus Stahlbacteria bacterium]|nr:threonine--tRNA ligase [Candidatus Stahlbacteria bacterium]